MGQGSSANITPIEPSDDDDSMSQPWHFWKWLIPVYASLLCVSVLVTISFFVTVYGSEEFLLYVGDYDDEVAWIFLPTLPTAMMVFEYPFNMIPMDWPMLIFVELLFLIYIFINFLYVALDDNHDNIYDAFDWYQHTSRTFLNLFICMAVLAIIFAIFCLATQKLKLPRYAKRREE